MNEDFAYMYWGVGQDDFGYYVCAKFEVPGQAVQTFTAEARFRSMDEALTVMETMADNTAQAARAQGINAKRDWGLWQ